MSDDTSMLGGALGGMALGAGSLGAARLGKTRANRLTRRNRRGYCDAGNGRCAGRGRGDRSEGIQRLNDHWESAQVPGPRPGLAVPRLPQSRPRRW